MMILWKNRWARIIYVFLLILLVLLVVPTVIMGELIYSASRQTEYQPLQGYNELTLSTTDSVQLQIWYTNSSAKVAILVHGHSDHASLMEERYAPIFEKAGYDLVLLDMRNHGRSEHAPPVTMGIEEKKDVITTLEWIDQQHWDEKVGTVQKLPPQI